MNCTYYVNGKRISQAKFKQLLYDGLLDQLVETKGFNVEGFKPDSSYSDSVFEGSSVGPVRLTVNRKINRPTLLNTERKVVGPDEGQNLGDFKLEMPRKNPLKVLNDSNKKIKKNNKEKNLNSKENNFILVSKIGDDIVYGELKNNPLAKNNKVNEKLKESLKEGGTYMLIESADGLTPVWLRNSFLGETKDAPAVRKAIRSLFNKKESEESKKLNSNFITDRLYKFTITVNEENVVFTKVNPDGTVDKDTFDNSKDAEIFVLGNYDSNGKYIGEVDLDNKGTQRGQIARVDRNYINNTNKNDVFNNEYYANQGYLTTDLTSDKAGNFYHSSSFEISFTPNNENTKNLFETLNNDENIESISATVEDSVAEEAAKNPIRGLSNMTEEEVAQQAIYDSFVEEERLKKEEDKEKNAEGKSDVANRLLNSSLELSDGSSIEEQSESSTIVEEEDDVDFFDDIDDGLEEGADNTRTKETKSASIQTESDIHQELADTKRIVGNLSKVYGYGLSKLEDLERYLPQDIYERMLRARKQGKFLHGLYTDAAVYLSTNAMRGTGFHEAFHVVFNLSLSPAQRLALIRETQERFADELGENPTFIEVEEVLADKFMDYALSEGTPNKSLGQKINDFFKSLWREIQMFFSPNSRISIDKVFEDMNLGIYAKKTSLYAGMDLSKMGKEGVRYKLTEKRFENPDLEAESIQFLQIQAFKIIEDFKKENKHFGNLSDPQIISRIGVHNFFSNMVMKAASAVNEFNKRLVKAEREGDKNRIDIYKNALNNANIMFEVLTNEPFENIKKIYKGQIDSPNLDVVKVGDRSIRYVLKSQTDFLKAFTRSLRPFGIKISLDKVNLTQEFNEEETSINEGIEEGINEVERWQQAYIEINPNDTLSQLVKRKLATIKKRVIRANEPDTFKVNSLGAYEFYSLGEVFNFLGKNITDSYTEKEMLEKIESLVDTKPFMKDVLELAKFNASFRAQLRITLASKTFQEYSIIYEKDGEYKIISANKTSLENVMINNVIGDFLIEDSKFFEKFKDGPRKGQVDFETINKTEVQKSIDKFEGLVKKYINARTKEEIMPSLKEVSEVLTDANINLSPEQIKNIWNPKENSEKASFNNIKEVLDSATILFKKLKSGDNPFLNLVPTEFLTKKGKKYSSTYLESFTRTIIDAFEDDLTAAHRNADNKTVYAIQQSNFLNKMLSKLKKQETLDEYLNKIENDEILNNLPLIQSLTDDDGKITGVAGNLEVTVIDALARSGKSKSVPYTKLSDPEMVAVEMALFHNSNNSQYARFKFPVPSDAPTMPTLKASRKTNEQVIEDLVVIGMSEIKRINKFKKLPKDAKARRIVNYKDKATQFNILSFLNDKITNPDTVSEEQMREYIVNYLENDFIEKHKEAYKEAGAIKSFEKGKNGDIVFSEKIISSEYNTKSKRKDFYINFLYNQYLMNAQISTLFAGEPAFYKNTVDYQKRFKQIVSPGTFTNHERVGLHYHGYIFKDEYVPSTKESAEFVIENIKKSNLPEQKKKELIAKWEDMSSEEEGAKTNNTSDGATFISIDRMLDIERSLDRITDEKLEAAERIRNGVEKPGDAGLFNIYKPFVFTKTYNNGIETPLQKKDSEMLLTKSYAYRKDSNGNFMYPKLVEAYNILNDENSNASFISFESAIKEGRIENLGKEGKSDGHTVLEKVVENGVTRYKLPENAEIITLNHEDWRLQQETPNHFQEDYSNHGSQIRVLSIADLDPNDTESAVIAEEYQSLIADNIRESFEKVRDRYLDKDGNIDIVTLTENLKEEFTDRDAGEEYFEAVKIIENEFTKEKETTLPLWHPLLTYKIETMLNSFFKNKVTKQKMSGGSLINATSYGTDNSLQYIAETNTYQALLPQWSRKFFPKDKDGKPDLSVVPKELVKAIAYRIPTEDKYSMFNIEVVGFNDAAAGGHIILPPEATTIAGLDFDIDKMYMMIPNFRINKDGEYEYIKYSKDGSDISSEQMAYTLTKDISKLRIFIKDYIKEDQAKDFFDDIEQSRQNMREAFKSRSVLFQESPETIELLNEQHRLYKEIEKETDEDVILAKEIKLDEVTQELSDYFNISDNLEFTTKAYEGLQVKLERAIELARKQENFDFSLFISKEMRDNRIIELMHTILEKPHTALSTIDPGNFDKAKEIGMKMRILKIDSNTTNKRMLAIKKKGLKIIDEFNKGKIEVKKYREKLEDVIEEYEDVDFNINLPSTQLELFRRNMTGKELIGPIANHNTNHAKAQFTDLRLAEPINFDGYSFDELSNIYSPYNEARISKVIASLLAAVVDNASDPISAHLNLNMFTVNTVALLARLGVQEDSIFAFINQPIIEELTKKYFNERGAIGDDVERLYEVKKDWTAKLNNKIKKDGGKKSDNIDVLNLETLENAINNRDTIEYYETQLAVLNHFEDIYATAIELSQTVQITRVDTKPVGPTNGETYSMVNKQDKVLNKKNPKILNKEELLVGNNTKGLIINPAFQRYGWMEPINIMNKIFPSIGSFDGLNINYSTLGKIKNYFSTMKKEGFSITESEARHIDQSFKSAVMSTIPFFHYKKDGKNQAAKVIIETPKKLSEFRNKYPDSKYSRFLKQLEVTLPDKQVPFTTIRFRNIAKKDYELKNYRLLWENMLTDPNDEVRNLAFDLVKYTYFSGGFDFGPFSFFGLIPVKFYTDKFARDPLNKDRGLVTSKNKTYRQVMETMLNRESKDIFKDKFISRFIVQYMQGTAEKSMIIPTVKVDEIKENIAPNGLPEGKLEDNEVLVVGAGNRGSYNTGDSGYVFNGTKGKHNPKISNIGDKGKYVVYGKTNQITQGMSGKGFGVKLYPEVFNEDRTEMKSSVTELNNLKKNNPEEYEDLRNKQLSMLKNSLDTLVSKALEEESMDFRLTNLYGPFNFKPAEIREILKSLNKKYGKFPDNIALPKNYEIRGSGKARINKKDDNEILTLPSKYNSNLKRGGEYPAFLKVKDGRTIKLFRRISKEKVKDDSGKMVDPLFIHYTPVNTLGYKQFLKEFDMLDNIQESALSEILENQTMNNTQVNFAPGMTDDYIDDSYYNQMSEKYIGENLYEDSPNVTEPTMVKPSKSSTNPLGSIDSGDFALPDDFAENFSEDDVVDMGDLQNPTETTVEESSNNLNTSYNNYVDLFNKAVKEGRRSPDEYLTKDIWDNFTERQKKTEIKCL